MEYLPLQIPGYTEPLGQMNGKMSLYVNVLEVWKGFQNTVLEEKTQARTLS